MDKLNLNLYVEQVNHEADNTTTVDKWDENEEELALSNVVDANTEFKSRRSGRDTTPSSSYGLPGDSQILEQRKLTPKPQLEKKHILAKELIQLQAECVHKELEETLEGCSNRSEKGFRLFKLPEGERNEERRKKWIQNIGRKEPIPQPLSI